MDEKERKRRQLFAQLNDFGLEQWIREFAETLPIGTRRQELLNWADKISHAKQETLALIKDITQES